MSGFESVKVYTQVSVIGHPAYSNGSSLWVANGKIVDHNNLSDIEKSKAEYLEEPVFLAPGWVDGRVRLHESQDLVEESMANLVAISAYSGTTHFVLHPCGQYHYDSEDAIEAVCSSAKAVGLGLKVVGAISVGNEGKKISEWASLASSTQHNGCIGIGDGKGITNTDILSKALQYTKLIRGRVFEQPVDYFLSMNGQVHESRVSNLLGLKGIPRLAEVLSVERGIELLRYYGGALHFDCVSTQEAVQLIATGKKEGLPLTCSIAAAQLCFSDEDLLSFDANLKVTPPFREAHDVLALQEGLQDGTIDYVVSNHLPLSPELKEIEFDLASFGQSTAPLLFHVLLMGCPTISADRLVEVLSLNPRIILGLDAPSADDYVLFGMQGFTKVEPKNWPSIGYNCPFFGKELPGKILATGKATAKG